MTFERGRRGVDARSRREPGVRRGPAEPVVPLQGAAGNAAVAGLLGRRRLQRAIRVGDETYGVEDAREFRRSLMLNLRAGGYAELGTRALWVEVDRGLEGSSNWTADSWDQLLAGLVAHGFLDKPLPSSGFARGPRRLGERPKWSSETAAAIRHARSGEGLAARHVLASSTLGLAVERAYAPLPELNRWLDDHGQPSQPTDAAARRAIWTTVHNFAGNLWMGPSEANTAIGFVRPVLQNIKAHLPTTLFGLIDVKATQELIRSSLVTGGQDNERNRTWNLLLADLASEIGELGWAATRADVDDLIDMYYRNADIDPPRLADDEYDHIVRVWHMLQDPKQVLPALRLFMSRPLRHSIAS